MQFGARFHIDHQDVGVQRRFDLVLSLPDPGKDDLTGVGAHLQTSHQLAGRHDIEPGSEIIEEPQYTKVRQRLHRKADNRIATLERIAHCTEMAAQSARAIDVNGGADPCSDVTNCHIFGKQPVVPIGEIIHLVCMGRIAAPGLIAPRPLRRAIPRRFITVVMRAGTGAKVHRTRVPLRPLHDEICMLLKPADRCRADFSSRSKAAYNWPNRAEPFLP